MNDRPSTEDFEGEDLDLVAAEYVFGTLDLRERMAFMERARTNDGVRRSLEQWEARCSGLGGCVRSESPSAEVWGRIERALPGTGNKPHPFKVIDGGGRSLLDRTPELTISRDRWRLLALVSSGLAAALMLFVGSREFRQALPPQPSAMYVAAVNRGGDKPALIVQVDLKTRQVFIRPVAAEAPTGRSLELWYIGDNKPPRSMGLVNRAAETLKIPEGATGDGATFAVSVEPEGGSKTGGPTGPVVYSGQLVER